MSIRTEIGREAPATRVPFAPGAVAATDVQRAVEAVQTSSNGVASDLAAHLADTVGAHAASAISFTQTGTGASARDVDKKLWELALTPQDFGAVADGYAGTDNADAFDRWFVACMAQGRPGYIPAGDYRIRRQLAWDVSTNVKAPLAVNIHGAGKGLTNLWFDSGIAAPCLKIYNSTGAAFYHEYGGFVLIALGTDGPALQISGGIPDAFNHCRFTDIHVRNTRNVGGLGGIAVEINYAVFCEFQITAGCGGNGVGTAIHITCSAGSKYWGATGNCDIGLLIDGSQAVYSNSFQNMDFEELDVGVEITNGNAFKNTFYSPVFSINDDYAINATTGYENVFVSPQFQSVGAKAGSRVGITGIDGPRPDTIAVSAVASSALTGGTSETTFATVTVPGKIMGPNGFIEIWTLWSFVGTGGNWTPRIRINNATSGTAFLAAANASSLKTAQYYTRINNRNDASSQVGAHSNFAGYGASAGALLTSAINTAANFPLYITGQLANSADSLVLEGYEVKVTYRP